MGRISHDVILDYFNEVLEQADTQHAVYVMFSNNMKPGDTLKAFKTETFFY